MKIRKIVAPAILAIIIATGSIFAYTKYLNYKSENEVKKHTEEIEDWEVERKTLVLEEQEMLKATKTFFVQSNLLLNFCKDCHSAFLKGNAEQKRKIVQMVCSNFSYDGSNIVIEPNPIFKAVIKNSLCNSL